MRSQLKKIEDLGVVMEEVLILDNKYIEYSIVGLVQQWDQFDQLGMRMQYNFEQQIQVRYLFLVSAGVGGMSVVGRKVLVRDRLQVIFRVQYLVYWDRIERVICCWGEGFVVIFVFFFRNIIGVIEEVFKEFSMMFK